MEKLNRAIEIWKQVCKKWNDREYAQLALGSEFWEPAGPEISIKGSQADDIMYRLKEALSDEDVEPVEALVEKILTGTHKLQQ